MPVKVVKNCPTTPQQKLKTALRIEPTTFKVLKRTRGVLFPLYDYKLDSKQ